MTFADTLRELRQKAGLSQSQLALAAGLSLGVVRDYEQKTGVLPSLPSAFRLADALGVGVEVFREAVIDLSPRTGRPRKVETSAGDDQAEDKPGKAAPASKAKRSGTGTAGESGKAGKGRRKGKGG